MTPKEHNAVGAFLDSCGTLTLATSGPAGAWAASLFFARDAHLNLYFISSTETRHVQDFLANPSVAVTVNADYTEWAPIRGLQIAGTVERLGDEERPAAERLYLDKFQDLRPLLAGPASEAERNILQAFRASSFFRIRPGRIRMIDNTKGFGYNQEFLLPDSTTQKPATCP